MPILLQCNCGKRLKVPDEMAGRRGKCPACSTVLEIPAPDSTNDVRPTVAAPDPLEGLDDEYGIAPSAPVAPRPARSPYASPAPAGDGRAASPFGGGAPMGVSANVGRPVSVDETNKYVAFHFTGVDPNAIAAGVEAFFLKRRYKLESGTPLRGVFGIGNDIARILLGGFVKRSKFRVGIVGNAQSAQLTVTKGMSGVWGGLIGYAAMNKETKKILSGLRTHFGG